MKTLQAILIGGLAMGMVSCRVDDTFYSNLLRSDVYVQQYDDNKFDFLWVLDNSASMAPRREFVRDNMQAFLNILNSRKAVDFQMVATTTDMLSQSGDLIANGNGLRVVRSAHSADPVADFASIVDSISDSPTSFWEQGLESAYQAVLHHRGAFSRNRVPLVVILVTDEDDFSCADNCWGSEPENNLNWTPFTMDRYIDFFRTIKLSDNSEVLFFPIVGLPSSSCTVDSLGDRYVQVQEAVGGVSRSGSICNGELRQSYETIAQVIADRGMVFKLSARGSQAGMRVYIDGILIPSTPENYRFDEALNAVVFTGFIPRSGSVIEVTYAQRMD